MKKGKGPALTTPKTRRLLGQAAIAAKLVGPIFAAGFVGFAPPLLAVPLVALMTWAAVVIATKYDSDAQLGPSPRSITVATIASACGAGWMLWLACSATAHISDMRVRVALTLLTAVTVVMPVRSLARRVRPSNDTAPVLTAVGSVKNAFREDPARASLVVGLILAIAAFLAFVATPVAPLIAAAAFLPLAAAGWMAAKDHGDVCAEVHQTFTGAQVGGQWTPLLAAAGRAPVAMRWVSDSRYPDVISFPLPTNFSGGQASSDRLEEDLLARTSGWGVYSLGIDSGSGRCVTLTRAEPLPERLEYDGRPADGLKIWLGKGLVNRQMAARDRSLSVGQIIDVFWDLALIPHALFMGGTGSGKSIAIQSALTQWLVAGLEDGRKLVILDPKMVGFTKWVGRPGLLTLATTPEDVSSAIQRVREEMMARYAVMAEHQVDHISLLPEGIRPPYLLVCTDEGTEAVNQDKVASTDLEGKEINEYRAKTAAALSAIVRLGRAAGVYSLTGTQRPDTAQGFAGNTKANMEGRLILGAADETARGMAGFGGSKTEPDATVKGRGLWGRVNTPPIEVQIAYAGNEDLDRWLPRDGKTRSVVPVDAPITDRVAGAVDVSTGLSLLRDEILAGRLTDADARSCGYTDVTDVRKVIAGWEQCVDDAAKMTDTETEEQASARLTTAPLNTMAANGQPATPVFKFNRVEPFAPDTAQAELDRMIGLPTVKAHVAALASRFRMAKLRESKGIGFKDPIAPHMALMGNPGTGKTVVVRSLASLLKDAGVLTSGHVIWGDRSTVVGAYQGHSALKVEAAFDAAEGGVLFIDEGHSLANKGDSFAQEAVSAIVKNAEDRRGRVLLIMAGYTSLMPGLLRADPGLASRLSERIIFPDYTNEELGCIFRLMVGEAGYVLADDAEHVVDQVITDAPRNDSWANARTMRNMVDGACKAADVRLDAAGAHTHDDIALVTLTAEDVRAGSEATEPVVTPPVQDVVEEGAQDVVQDGVEGEVLEGTIVDDAVAGDADFDWMDDAVSDLVAGLIATDASTVKA